ncbi:MAG: serine hydrolase [Patescibacteria group bacterium]
MLTKFKKILIRYKKTILVIAVCLLILITMNVFSKTQKVESGQDNKLAPPSSLKKTIKENAVKYHPKFDWLTKNPYEMTLTAESAIAIDQNTGQVLYAKNVHKKLPPASITKVLTLITVLENMKTDKLCTVSQRAADTQPNKIVMKPGEKMKVDDLLYGLTMISANDAAEVLAECYDGGRDKFIAKMNDKIKMLGLSDSIFKDPNGLNDVDQVSSAYDLGTVTRYGLLTQPSFLEHLGKKGDYSVYPSDHNESHSWYQISNLLSTYPGMVGAKTGYTYIAKNTYIGIAKRDGREIIIVYFAAQTTTSDATALLDYGFSVKPNI